MRVTVSSSRRRDGVTDTCSGRSRPVSSMAARISSRCSAIARRPSMKPYQPSAERAARRCAARVWPPTTTGSGRCTGRGWASTPSKFT